MGVRGGSGAVRGDAIGHCLEACHPGGTQASNSTPAGRALGTSIA